MSTAHVLFLVVCLLEFLEYFLFYIVLEVVYENCMILSQWMDLTK